MGVPALRHFRQGLYGALAILAFAAIAIIVQIALSYDGKCGGLIPALAGPKPCPFWEYMTAQVSFTALILALTYWPLIVALLVLPAAAGYLLDRQKARGTTKAP
jgi:hypothetical protein